jgi:negative regulator of flagellin synthesis FlgM
MKINETQRIGAINQYRSNNEQRSDTAAKKVKKMDNVEISPEAKELLTSQAAEDSARTEKIKDLKHAVATGTYQVDVRQLAEKIFPFIK